MVTNSLINALGQALFESCGQALLIYAALQVLTYLFPGISSKYRYRINYLALTAICCWFLVTLIKTYLYAIAIPNYTLLIYNNNLMPAHGLAPTLLQQAETCITKYAKYITGLYLTGLLLQAFRLAGGLVHINYIRKLENLTKDRLLSQKVHLLGKTLKMSKTVSLYFSEHIQVPLTIGHLKPIIIFPFALINNLDNDQVEAILLHELAHIKRHDYLLNLLQCIMETILCFNPFAWLISKTIREEREYCCDDIVVGTDYNNYSYAKALFIVAQQNTQNYPLAMASAGTKKYPLLNRIKRLHTMKVNDSLPKFNLAVIVAIAAIGALLAWGIPQYSMAKAKINKPQNTVTVPVTKFVISYSTKYDKDIILQPLHKRKLTLYRDTAINTILRDTLVNSSKPKFKIVIEDEKGNKKEYNSLGELPQADKDEFLKENPGIDSFNLNFNDSAKFASLEKFKKSPEFKKQMLEIKIQSEAMRKQFDSPEFKKQIKDIKLQAEKMRKDFENNPKLKKQIEDIKLQAEKIQQQANSPEFKKQMKEMQQKIQVEVNNDMKMQLDMQKKIQVEVDNNMKVQQDDVLKKLKDEVDENIKNVQRDTLKAEQTH